MDQHANMTPLSGDLKQYMLPEIFLKAVLQQFSGILDIENEQLSKLIYFKNGNVVFVESNDREELFGQFLMRRKLIEPKALSDALQELANQKDLKLGEVLLKRGIVSPNSLMEHLNLHQEERLFNAFSIKKGTFRIITNMEWPPYVNVFPFRTLNVFFTAIEKHVSMDEIRDYAMLAEQSLVQLKHQPNHDLPLPPFASRLLNTLNRNLISVEQLSKKISITAEKILTYLFIFKLADWISVENATRKETTAPEKVITSQSVETPSTEQQMVEKKEINPVMLQRMEMDYKTLEGMNFYQIFGLLPDFTLQQIQVKFFQVISEYKKFEEYPKGKEMVVWIKTAFEVLREPKLRAIYDRRFAFRKKTPVIERAEREFYRALRLIEKEDLEGALLILKKINEKASDSTFKAYYAWVLFRTNPQQNLSEANKFIEEGFALYPADPFAHYIAGQIQQYRKNYPKAEGHFRSALQVYPNYTDATNALDSLRFEKTKEKRIEDREKKEKAKNEKPGFFDLSVGGFKIGNKD